MQCRNYSVEQWLSGMINDRRFYPVHAVMAYLEEQLESAFVTVPKFGLSITALSGYFITVDEKENIVSVSVYDSMENRVYSTSWELRD